jgi:hypothetical protein
LPQLSRLLSRTNHGFAVVPAVRLSAIFRLPECLRDVVDGTPFATILRVPSKLHENYGGNSSAWLMISHTETGAQSTRRRK